MYRDKLTRLDANRVTGRENTRANLEKNFSKKATGRAFGIETTKLAVVAYPSTQMKGC